MDNPPIWFTKNWLKHIPDKIQAQIWTDEELNSLLTSIKTADENRGNSTRQKITRVTGKKKEPSKKDPPDLNTIKSKETLPV